ncbi:MAG: hypothetical protein SGJ10_07390 [Bacteroidota bacterium]|nr:hypothetical protein [Bacteroidota bacterium]
MKNIDPQKATVPAQPEVEKEVQKQPTAPDKQQPINHPPGETEEHPEQIPREHPHKVNIPADVVLAATFMMVHDYCSQYV